MMLTPRERYQEFLRSGPLKRVYIDLPESAHTMLKDHAEIQGLPMKAALTLLIADAVEKPKRKKKASRKKPAKKARKRVSKRKTNRSKK